MLQDDRWPETKVLTVLDWVSMNKQNTWFFGSMSLAFDWVSWFATAYIKQWNKRSSKGKACDTKLQPRINNLIECFEELIKHQHNSLSHSCTCLCSTNWNIRNYVSIARTASVCCSLPCWQSVHVRARVRSMTVALNPNDFEIPKFHQLSPLDIWSASPRALAAGPRFALSGVKSLISWATQSGRRWPSNKAL